MKAVCRSGVIECGAVALDCENGCSIHFTAGAAVPHPHVTEVCAYVLNSEAHYPQYVFLSLPCLPITAKVMTSHGAPVVVAPIVVTGVSSGSA